MCGRFTQAQIAELDREIFKLLELPDLEPKYNIAPTEDAAVIRERAEGGRNLDLLRWGLIPSWANDPSIGNRLINARAESVTQKAAFRDAFHARRALVPVDGFYEWEKTPHGRQPYYIRVRGGEVYTLAGLWEHFESRETGPVESFTIITTDSNELVRPIHDRMPVILPQEAYDAWLDPANQDVKGLKGLLRPFPADEMDMYPVSRYVNKPQNKDAECVQPVELP
jgi:putative SOS response-associated peptidase YedK